MAKSATAKKADKPAKAPETAADPVALEVVEPEKATPVSVARFGLQVEHNHVWRVNVPYTVTPEQVMDEGFWCHVSMHLNPGDEIHVFPDNMKWELVLHVVGSGNQYAHVMKKELYEYAPREDALKIPSKYTVDFQGTTHKWRAIREGKVLKSGFETEGLARRYVQNHEAAVNR